MLFPELHQIARSRRSREESRKLRDFLRAYQQQLVRNARSSELARLVKGSQVVKNVGRSDREF